MPKYLIILISGFVVTVFVAHKYNIHPYHSKKEMLQVTLNFFIFGLLLDYFGTYNHYWVFPGNGLLGMRIIGLPIEEFLLYLILPYSVLVIYKFYSRNK